MQTGNATGTRLGRPQRHLRRPVNATVTENGQVVVVQVAIIVNIGIGVAGSGGNVAGASSAHPPRPDLVGRR